MFGAATELLEVENYNLPHVFMSWLNADESEKLLHSELPVLVTSQLAAYANLIAIPKCSTKSAHLSFLAIAGYVRYSENGPKPLK